MSAIPKIKKSTNSKGHVLSLLEYIKQTEKSELDKFAKSCGTTVKNLLQIAYGGSVSARLSKKINEESKNKISLSDLRPDIFS
ncbi:helix-turn-helix domain-containing protein [Acinetobacter soli]|uniref:helix-turn-helix domain-containing protein n=1 Tax=Acinetobacter soli TaxID=487316 RepID=UPI0012309EE1|nr:helix-turn-helix domain-containing protein [Acinetobacter soli]